MYVCIKICEILDYIGSAQTLWSCLCAFLVILFFVLSLTRFRKKTNEQSQNMINQFISNKKYIPDAYVELNDNLEHLRYFVYSKRWKKRIVKRYNLLFRGNLFRKIRKHIKGDINVSFRLFRFQSVDNIVEHIKATKTFFEEIRSEERSKFDTYGEFYFIIRTASITYIDELNLLLEYCDMLMAKNVIAVGTAGNGKTSILCRLAELINANKAPCFLFNAKEIKKDCVQYFLDKLPVSKLNVKHKNLFLYFMMFLLWLRKRYMYVLIDAINENDDSLFVETISDLNEFVKKYRRIKLIYTCRSEYFEHRYNKMFLNKVEGPYIFQLRADNYDKRAAEKLFTVYAEYFDVSTNFSEDFKSKLLRSLLLMRLFFEVNSKKSECSLEFRNAEIFKIYLEKVSKENTKIDVHKLVSDISKEMFKKFSFNEVKIRDVGITTANYSDFAGLLDNSIILSKTIVTGVGITEAQSEYVYFVFDEFRDYCLAQYLLRLDEDNNNPNYESLFENLNKLYEEKLSPIEGITKYSYYHFRNISRFDLCRKILKEYGSTNVQNIAAQKKRYWETHRDFSNFGCSLVFMNNNELYDFEYDYLLELISDSPYSYWSILEFLLKNEVYNTKPNLSVAVSLLSKLEDDKSVEIIMRDLFRNENYYTSEGPEKIIMICECAKIITRKEIQLSNDFKSLLILLILYYPHNSWLFEYHKLFDIEHSLVDHIISTIKSTEFRKIANDTMMMFTRFEDADDFDYLDQLLMFLE
ncbi:MAG: ATP-binding protein [Ruminococcaceae bacterium]|nr:ATP-binding protein [Oscillospiraceae bacterium]